MKGFELLPTAAFTLTSATIVVRTNGDFARVIGQPHSTESPYQRNTREAAERRVKVQGPKRGRW